MGGCSWDPAWGKSCWRVCSAHSDSTLPCMYECPRVMWTMWQPGQWGTGEEASPDALGVRRTAAIHIHRIWFTLHWGVETRFPLAWRHQFRLGEPSTCSGQGWDLVDSKLSLQHGSEVCRAAVGGDGGRESPWKPVGSSCCLPHHLQLCLQGWEMQQHALRF